MARDNAPPATSDDEDLDETNRNRFVGARYDDPVPGSAKVDLVSRMVREISPDVEAIGLERSLISDIRRSVCGCKGG